MCCELRFCQFYFMNCRSIKICCTVLCFRELFTLLFLLYGYFGHQNFLTMLQNILSNKISILYILLIAICFVCIRAFENIIFYDPLLSYYKRDFYNINLPELNNFKIALHFTYRYLLNSILSVALLWLLFKDESLVNFSVFLYLVLFVILIASFFFVLQFYANNGKMTLFYIRRFIIQPIFIIIFIPGFWFQKRTNS